MLLWLTPALLHPGAGVCAAEDGTLCPARAPFQGWCHMVPHYASDLSFGSALALISCVCVRQAISNGVTRILWPPVTASTAGIRIMPDIFKHPLTHISSIPKGSVEWLLVMLEQVLDISKAFNLEDLWFLLDDLPETNSQSDQTNICMCSLRLASQLKWTRPNTRLVFKTILTPCSRLHFQLGFNDAAHWT